MSSLNPTRRQAPRPARPVQRHFAKKAPKDARDPDASSDEEEEAEQHHQQQHQYQQASHAGEETSIQQIGEYGKDEDEEEEEGGGMVVHRQGKKPAKPKAVRVALGNVEIKDGRVLVNGLEESGRTLVEQQMKQESSESESEEEEEEEEKEESSEEESSEEELPKPQLRPVFVSKQARSTLKERDAAAFDSEEAVKKREAAAEERKKQSRNMVGESIKKGMEEKEAKAPGAEIDDTDGLNPEEEFSAWRLRELMRLKREKEAERAREEERLEIERRRAMPEEQRLKEDLERAQKLRDEKPKGNGVFLQKYWHKGAFFQDTEELQMRDFSTKLESQVDVSLLPKLMQVKDFGKRSRTKYTHLKDQDTTIQNQPPKAGGSALPEGPPGGQGCFLCGGPHLKRDCPQNDPSKSQGGQRTGANKTDGFSSRKWGDTSDRTRDDPASRGHDWRDRSPPVRRRSRSPRSRHYDDDRRIRDDRKSYSHDARRSRSPPVRRRSRSPHRSNRYRSRSRSPRYKDDDRHKSDRSPKRRRVEV